MKKDIHPKYYADATVTCHCGAKLQAGSVQENIEVEICSQCHPFYTGKKKMLDSTGRVDRFNKMFQKTAEKKAEAEKAKVAKEKKTKKTTKETK